MSFIQRSVTTANLLTVSTVAITKFTSQDGTPLVQVGAGAYTVLKDEPLVFCMNLDSARTITLPDVRTIPAGADVVIKDAHGRAATNNITIATQGLTPDVDGLLFDQVYAGSDLGTVVAASAAALASCTASGTGVGKTLTATANGAITVDGVTPSASDAVLIKDQVNPLDNGLYTVTAVGDGSNPFVLTRKTSFDAVAECLPGSTANISAGGTANGSTRWSLAGGIDGAKTATISTAFASKRYASTGRNWRAV